MNEQGEGWHGGFTLPMGDGKVTVTLNGEPPSWIVHHPFDTESGMDMEAFLDKAFAPAGWQPSDGEPYRLLIHQAAKVFDGTVTLPELLPAPDGAIW